MRTQRAAEAGSYLSKKDFIKFDFQEQESQRRWTCSCGSNGKWYKSHHRYQIFDLWKTHLRRKHPEHEL